MKTISEIQELIVNENDDLKIALRSLNNTSKKICLVINKKKKLVGVITDGDIRRSLLKKKDKLNCGFIASKKYLSTKSNFVDDKLLAQAKKKKNTKYSCYR